MCFPPAVRLHQAVIWKMEGTLFSRSLYTAQPSYLQHSKDSSVNDQLTANTKIKTVRNHEASDGQLKFVIHLSTHRHWAVHTLQAFPQPRGSGVGLP